MSYRIIKYKDLYHVIPEHDTVDHTASKPCWCQPKFDPELDTRRLHNPFCPDEEGEGEEPDDGKYH